jgi:hypothetical protein
MVVGGGGERPVGSTSQGPIGDVWPCATSLNFYFQKKKSVIKIKKIMCFLKYFPPRLYRLNYIVNTQKKTTFLFCTYIYISHIKNKNVLTYSFVGTYVLARWVNTSHCYLNPSNIR